MTTVSSGLDYEERLEDALVAGKRRIAELEASIQSASEYIRRLELSLMEAEASDLYNVGDTVRVVGSRYDSYVFDGVIVDRDITDAEGKPYLVQTTDGKKRWCWANETKLVKAGGSL